MEQKKIDRINELARLAKQRELTAEEQTERQALRAEYIAAFRANLTAQLENTVIVDQDGNRIKPTRREQRK